MNESGREKTPPSCDCARLIVRGEVVASGEDAVCHFATIKATRRMETRQEGAV